jgi:drug/metabolite transporter (DMT)-like permease
MLVLATLYWGLSFPVIKALTTLNRMYYPEAGSWFVSAQAVAPRFIIAVVLMLLFGGRSGSLPTRAEALQGLVIGLFAAAGALLQTDGMQFTDASTSAFLTQFSAILVPAWIAIRARRNPGLLVWACCALVLVGVAILGHFNWRTLHLGRGGWETLLSAVFYTGQILWVGRVGFSRSRPRQVTLVMFAVQAALFSALAVGTAPSLRALGTPWGSLAWAALTLVLAVVCTNGAFSIMTEWQPRITSTEAGLIYCIEPVFASVFALFIPAIISAFAAIEYPNEKATVSLLIGGGLVTVANILVQSRAAPPEPHAG